MTAIPVQIVRSTGKHQFQLDDVALAEILLDVNVKDRAIVVVSVAGAFRKGKSFILDFFLRYLYAKYVHKKKEDDWLGDTDEPLVGFSWRGGSERDTTGIWMWSELFLYDAPNGEKIAIALMDTQGTFDSQSTVKECATVFALSTMLSSVLIFNVSQNIQEDDLQHLQLFTEYGRLAAADTGKKPFQHLQFLVRDWSFPYEAEYGPDGGMEILTNRLTVSHDQHPELQSLRRHIVSCFEDITCFLMPHPGLNVATNPSFDGRLTDVTSEFKTNLRILVPSILAPQKLSIKQINGQIVRSRDLLQYFISYMNIYQGNELPEPKTMLMATAEANNLTAVAAAKEMYMSMMEDVSGGNRPYLNQNQLSVEHCRIKDKAIEQFRAKRKMGGEEFSEKYRESLEAEIEAAYENFRAHNESKNIFKAARTPAVFLVVVFVTYVLSGIFGVVGLYTVANFANFIMGIALLTLALWAYIRYSGELRDIGTVLDEAANFLWDKFLRPIYRGCLSRGVAHLATNPEVFTGAASAAGAGRNVNGKVKRT